MNENFTIEKIDDNRRGEETLFDYLIKEKEYICNDLATLHKIRYLEGEDDYGKKKIEKKERYLTQIKLKIKEILKQK